MPPLDDRTRLEHMLEAASKAVEFVQGRSRDEMDEDVQLQMAVAYCLQIIGEAAVRLSEDTRKKMPHLPWDDIRGMRNRIVHVYFDLDTDILWRTVEEHLPELVETIKGYLGESH